MTKSTLPQSVKVARILGALGIVGGITFFYFRIFSVNNVTVALSFLLAVLTIATRWGLIAGLVASVASMLCLDFFFIPPVGSITIADPQNWVALSVFVVTAVIVSHLSASAKKQALESTQRQNEMERLYTLSRNLLLLEVHGPLAQEITNSIAQVFELPGLAFYDRTSDRIHRAGPHDIPVDAGKLRDTALQGTVFHDATTKTTVIPISLGGQPMGSLGIQGSQVSETALHAIANLTAITLERAHAQDVATRAEAARQSEELKSTMLDALAHEFKTPLTPIKAAVTSMLSDSDLSPTHQELLRIVDEETDRLNSMLTDAIQMSRIEAGQLQLHRSPQPLRRIVQAQLEKLGENLEGRTVTVEVPESLPPVSVDPEFIGIVIWQLVTNALRYTPPGSPLTLRASAEETEVIVSIEDCGPGISEKEQRRVFEKFYRGKDQRDRIPGTGMGLTIAREIVRAHHGRIWVESEPGKGAKFSFSVPRPPREFLL
ncbi:MAG TPA: ATP-binding protein [Terriglobia bacterium]|nr:ATP-binding protein [Terriglobia bacterium]